MANYIEMSVFIVLLVTGECDPRRVTLPYNAVLAPLRLGSEAIVVVNLPDPVV